jgi:L-threonylcarbamoyladenylate synthase
MATILSMTGERENDARHIAAAAEVIRAGGIVAIPTETVYGLAADALNPDAIAKIYEAKGRPSTNPLIIHVTSIDAAKELASSWPVAAQQLTEAFWPGPLTVIVPKNPAVPDAATAGLPSVAVRNTSHPVMRAVIDAAGTPLAAPSANKSQAVSPTRAAHVLKSLGDRVDMVIDAGTTEHGLESTVVDCTVVPPRVLRPGPVTIFELERVVGRVKSDQSDVADSLARSSPGMSHKHYSPQAAVKMVPAAKLAEVIATAEGPVGAFVLAGALLNPNATVTQMPADPVAYGAILYTELHRMDDAGVKTLVIEEVPNAPGWEAVRDRLRRASA